MANTAEIVNDLRDYVLQRGKQVLLGEIFLTEQTDAAGTGIYKQREVLLDGSPPDEPANQMVGSFACRVVALDRAASSRLMGRETELGVTFIRTRLAYEPSPDGAVEHTATYALDRRREGGITRYCGNLIAASGALGQPVGKREKLLAPMLPKLGGEGHEKLAVLPAPSAQSHVHQRALRAARQAYPELLILGSGASDEPRPDDLSRFATWITGRTY